MEHYSIVTILLVVLILTWGLDKLIFPIKGKK